MTYSLDIFSNHQTFNLSAPETSLIDGVPPNPFAPIITREVLEVIIKQHVAMLPSSITGQKQISEYFSKAFEEDIARLSPHWGWGAGDDNSPDVTDTQTQMSLEIKIAMNKDGYFVINSPWRGGVVKNRLRGGWHLLFSRSRDNDSWAAFFVYLTEEDWYSRDGYGAHQVTYEHLTPMSRITPVVGGFINSLYELHSGFLPDYSLIDKKKCNKVNELFQKLTLEEQSFILRQNRL